MKKFLIVGLGNIGLEYKMTRHNVGFEILDYFARKELLAFETVKLADKVSWKNKGKQFVFIKPSTFMNLSGKAIKYWSLKENIPLENILIITDEINLPYGKIRLKSKGSAGGHNGLKDIECNLNSIQYSRLRFGIGHLSRPSNQVQFVLEKWNKSEQNNINEFFEKCSKIILSFVHEGVQEAMNKHN